MVASLPINKAPNVARDQTSSAFMPKNPISGDAQTVPALPFRPRLQRPQLDQQPSSNQQSSLPSVAAIDQAQAWFYGYFDEYGALQIASSPSIRSSLKEAFSPALCEKLARIAAKENVSVCTGLAANDAIKYESPAFSSLTGNTQSFIRHSKRTLSKEFFSAKRRKSCPEDTEESFCLDSDYDAATVKAEEETVNSIDRDESEDDFVGASYTSIAVRVDDEVQMEKIIDTRLRQMQQVACKTIAKPWIKAKEPQKQTKYPYNGGQNKNEAFKLYGKENLGEINIPPWWPSTEGWPYRGCRHKEPDHLKKPERLVLLKHMLKICPVGMLKESTKEVGSGPTGLKPVAMNHLREIYRIREKQERFERGEIDGDTTIPVEQLPTATINGDKIEDGGKETSAMKTHDPSPSTAPQARVTLNSQASKQETATGEDFLMIDQEYNDLGKPGGEDMQVQGPKEENGHTTSQLMRNRRDTFNNDNTPPADVTVPLELNGIPQNHQPNYLSVESMQTGQRGLAAPTGLKATTKSFDTYFNPYDVNDSADLPNTHGLSHEPTWFTGYGSDLSHLHQAEPSCSSTQAMSFFNDNYCFGNTSMSNPYRGSIYDEFPDPPVAGSRGHLWSSHHQRRR